MQDAILDAGNNLVWPNIHIDNRGLAFLLIKNRQEHDCSKLVAWTTTQGCIQKVLQGQGENIPFKHEHTALS